MSARVLLRERVYRLFGQREKSEVVSHFKAENVPPSTIYRLIQRWELGIGTKELPKTGRPPILNYRDQRKVAKFAQYKEGVP